MKKLNYLFGLLMLVLASVSVKAQSNNDEPRWLKHIDAGAAQIQVTYRPSKLDQLNTMLNNNGISSLSGNNVWINLSMNHIHKNWFFEDGIGISPLSTGRSANGDLKAKYGQGQIFGRVGYGVSKSANYRVFPFVGLNLSDAMLKIQDNTRTQSTDDFSTELLNSTSNKTFWDPNLGIEIGGGFDYLIKLKPKQVACYTVERNIPIGIRMGYYLQVTSTKWKIDDYSLNNGPSQKQSNVFVSLNIGLGYQVRK